MTMARTMTLLGFLAILGLLLAATPVYAGGGGTSPNTCFANAQSDGFRLHVLCTEPEGRPCLAKAKAGDQWVKVCGET